MSERRIIRNSTAEFLIFQAETKEQGIEVMYAEETIWCTQKAMAALFNVGVPAISKHLANVFETGELKEEATISKMETVRSRQSLERDHGEVFRYWERNSGSGVYRRAPPLPGERIWAIRTAKATLARGGRIVNRPLSVSMTFHGGRESLLWSYPRLLSSAPAIPHQSVLTVLECDTVHINIMKYP